VRVAAFQAPGVTGSNIWLLPDPAAAAAMPGGHVWPAALTAAHADGSSDGSSTSGSNAAAVRAAVGASVGAVVGVVLLLGAVWLWYNR
jgi:hypothetical protein